MKSAGTDFFNAFKIITAWLIILIIFTGCDFPRGNPLDPKAFNYGTADPQEPELPTLDITSFHSSQWYPLQEIYTMEVSVYGALAETADSVKFVYRDTVFFSMNLSGNIWHQSIESTSFQSENLFDLVGVDHHANLYFGADVVSTEEACLYRIIEEVPGSLQPSEDDTVSLSPQFIWQSSEIKYFFTYRISINNVSTSGFVTEVARIEDILGDSTSYTYTDTLTPGSYYWTISIVDIYSNISRSLEAPFITAP